MMTYLDKVYEVGEEVLGVLRETDLDLFVEAVFRRSKVWRYAD